MVLKIGDRVYTDAGDGKFHGTIRAIKGERITIKYDRYSMVRIVPRREVKQD